MKNLFKFRTIFITALFCIIGAMSLNAQHYENLPLPWEKMMVEDDFINIIGFHEGSYIGYSNAGIYRTDDQGENWIKIADQRHIIDIKYSNGKIMFAYEESGMIGLNYYHKFHLMVIDKFGHVLGGDTFNYGEYSVWILNSISILSEDVVGFTVTHYAGISGIKSVYFNYCVAGENISNTILLKEYGQNDNELTYYFCGEPHAYFQNKFLTRLTWNGHYVPVSFSANNPEVLDTLSYLPTGRVVSDDALYYLEGSNITYTHDLNTFEEFSCPITGPITSFYKEGGLYFFHTQDKIYMTDNPLNEEYTLFYTYDETSPYDIGRVYHANGVFVSGVDGDDNVVQSTDNGENWEDVTFGRPTGSTHFTLHFKGDLLFTNHNLITESGESIPITTAQFDSLLAAPIVYKSDDFWTRSYLTSNNDIVAIDRSEDEGNSWQTVFLDSTDTYKNENFKFVFGEETYAYNNHFLLKSQDEGITWQILRAENIVDLEVIGDTLLVCNGEDLFVSHNAGSAWILSLEETKGFHYHNGRILAFLPDRTSMKESFDFGNSWEYFNFIAHDFRHNFQYDDKEDMIVFRIVEWNGNNYLSFDHGNTFYNFTGPFIMLAGNGWDIQYYDNSANFRFYGDYLYAQGNGTWRTKVFPSIFDAEATICEGDSLVFGDEILTTQGIYSGTFTDQNGEDSTANIYLAVTPKVVTEFNFEVECGDLFNGIQIINDTTLTETYVASNGCDSIIFMHLTTPPYATSEFSDETCFGEPYEINGNSYPGPGTYEIVYENEMGCDSIVTLHLTVLPLIYAHHYTEIQYGESFHGIPVYNDTIISETFTAQNGCDSLVHTHLFVVTDVDELKTFENLQIQPNPSTNNFDLSFTLKSPSNLTIEIYDILGRKVQSVEKGKKYLPGSHQIKIDAINWKPGTYFINLKTKEENKTLRVIKI